MDGIITCSSSMDESKQVAGANDGVFLAELEVL